MNGTTPLWLAIGLAAQAFFSARFLVQWVLSERARRSVLPHHFWYFSIAGAVLLLAYAAHQRDLVIALGQMAGLAIYLRNIELLRRSAGAVAPSFLVPWTLLVMLAVGLGLITRDLPAASALTRTSSAWMVLGFVGQALFTGRFLVQIWFSERAGTSVNPVHFWYLSLVGSAMLLAYAISTGDAVIILGQSVGMLVYARNLWLMRRSGSGGATSGASRTTGAVGPD